MQPCSTKNCCKQLVASCELKGCMQLCCVEHLHATKLHRVGWALVVLRIYTIIYD